MGRDAAFGRRRDDDEWLRRTRDDEDLMLQRRREEVEEELERLRKRRLDGDAGGRSALLDLERAQRLDAMQPILTLPPPPAPVAAPCATCIQRRLECDHLLAQVETLTQELNEAKLRENALKEAREKEERQRTQELIKSLQEQVSILQSRAMSAVPTYVMTPAMTPVQAEVQQHPMPTALTIPSTANVSVNCHVSGRKTGGGRWEMQMRGRCKMMEGRWKMMR